MKRLLFQPAPEWVREPAQSISGRIYDLVLLYMPAEDRWRVARRHETLMMLDEEFGLGEVLRRNAAMMSLHYASDN